MPDRDPLCRTEPGLGQAGRARRGLALVVGGSTCLRQRRRAYRC